VLPGEYKSREGGGEKVRGGPNEGSNVRALVEDVVTRRMVVNDGVEVGRRVTRKGKGKSGGGRTGVPYSKVEEARGLK